MNKWLSLAAMALLVVMVATPLVADDVTESDRMLCTAVQATRCLADGDCVSGPPWNWNIPQFIEVDLRKKTLSTTAASGENRATPITNVQRDDGLIVLQGVEAGRAFSFVITEETGMVSVAVAREGLNVAIFGACTPMTR